MKNKLITKLISLYAVIIIVVNYFFPQFGIYELLSICFLVHAIGSVVWSTFYTFPVRNLFAVLMILETLFGPIFQYHIPYLSLIPSSYKMSVESAEYYAYVLPAVCFFILGLFSNIKKPQFENINLVEIEKLHYQKTGLALGLILAGFLFTMLKGMAPSTLKFVFYLLAGFKFVGVFLLVLGRGKYLVWLLIVYGYEVAESLRSGMFHDLLVWLFFLAFTFSIRYNFNLRFKIIGLVSFFALVITIQLIKAEYRKQLNSTEQGGSFAAAADIASDKLDARNEEEASQLQTVELVNRINQGWIISRVMYWVPRYESHAYGETIYKYLEAAFLPRIIAPNKLVAGDQAIFDKYTGLGLKGSTTSMGMSSLGDGYANFGIIGGWIFMFCYGYLFNLCLQYIGKLSQHMPVLILFVPVIFAYPVRPDCETQTILGHFVKSVILLVIIFFFFKKSFLIRE